MTVIGYGWWIAVILNRDALAPEAPPWHSFPSDVTIVPNCTLMMPQTAACSKQIQSIDS